MTRRAKGRCALTLDRGADFARGVWLVDPLFLLDVVSEHMAGRDG